MKKLLFVATICLLLAVGTAYSAETKAVKAGSRASNAFYAGARSGLQSISADVTIKDIESSGSLARKFDYDNDGFDYGAFVGWKRYAKKWFVGLELEYMDSGTEVEKSDFYYKTTFKEGPGFSLSARGGYEFTKDTFLTARLGWIRREYSVSEWFDPDYRYKEDDDLDGVQVGLGMEYFICSSVSIVGDLRYTKYTDELSYNHFRPTAHNTKFEPSAVSFTLGVAYEF
ncbi:MAG: outer membrane beta-barrel protein [Deltaproteobacteria bacterium]|nr:outer membrane beta-barrel protein [Deltaproteobacteria bacterium]